MGKFTVDTYIPTVDQNQGLNAAVGPGQGQSFTGAAGWLAEAMFRIQRGATNAGTITAKLYAHTGTFGTTGVPSGAALATSDPINSSAILNGTYSNIVFTFSGANRVQLAAGTKYFITLDASAAGGTQFLVGSRTTAPAHGGNAAAFPSGGPWFSYGEDLYFAVYAYDTPLVVTNAASGVGSTKTTMNGQIDQIGAAAPTERGFVYATSTKPDPGAAAPGSSGYGGVYLESGTFGIASFLKKIASLNPLTTYYGRAFAKNSAGYAYGGEISFTMLNLTTVVFTGYDPADMFRATIDNSGGPLFYDAGSVDDFGEPFNYTFITATGLEAVRKSLELAKGWYWYADVGTNKAWFKQPAATATHKLFFGRHLTKVRIITSTEQIRNIIYFTGGEISGNNLLKVYKNDESVGEFGGRALRVGDNRVTAASEARAISESALDSNDDEQNYTRVEVTDATYDIALFKPGDTVGFAGFGNYVDSLILQIVRIEYHPDYVVLTLGSVAPRVSNTLEQVKRGLIAQQTVKNPSTPS